MQLEHIITLALCGLGIFHGFSIGLYLLVTPKNLSKRLLGLLLLVFGLRISKSILLYFTADLDFLLITLGLSLILAFGPLFLFYIKSLLQKDLKLTWQNGLHLLPFLLFFTLNGFGLLSREFYQYFGIYFIYLHFLTYIITSFFWQKRQFQSTQISAGESSKKWINLIHMGMAFIWLSYFIFLLDGLIPYIAGPITYSLVIYPLSFWAMKNKVHKPSEKKYQNSRLDQVGSRTLISQLEQFIQQEKPYLDPELKLADLATRLNTTPHLLSQVVNETYGQNFQQYLNVFRVDTAKELLKSEDTFHLTIAAIAFDSGFNSLSAFNTAFKKVLQQTPSQFRKEQKQLENY